MESALDNKEKKAFSFSILRRMFFALIRLTRMVYRGQGWLLFSLVSLSVLISLAPFMQSGASGYLVNQLVEIQKLGSLTENFYLALVLLILASVVLPLFSVIYQYFDYLSWFTLDKELEFAVMRHRGKLDIATHEDPEFNDLVQKTNDSMYRARNFIDEQFQMLQSVVGIVTASAIVYSFNPVAFAVVFAGTIPQFFFEVTHGRRLWSIHGARAGIRRRFWELRGFFQPLRSLIELKLFQSSRYFIRKAEELFNLFKDEQRDAERKRFAFNVFSVLFSYGTIIAATVWFVFDVVNGKMQIGTLVFVLTSLAALRANFSGFFIQLAHQYQDGLFVLDVLKFLDTEPRVTSPRRGKKLSARTPEIVFENVSFAYPGSEKPAISSVNLRIKPGEKIAFVGHNGAGKTTLIKLLCRFYDPTEGRITVGGHDLKEIDLGSWYRHIGALFQEYMNYGSFSVAETIALGDTGEKFSLARAKNAAKKSEAEDFILEFQNKYGQILGKAFAGGVSPSLGQWQKLALARVFYRNPNVFILDEPTSSIDAEAEANIFEKMENLPPDRTVFLISHRFSTVRNANTIVFLERGKVKEQGTHEELLAKNGMYARLFRMQAKGYR